jgi:glycosyltransferase involved in cell wall biosynthesis
VKVLFDHPSPFLLAHGGFQIQIEQTKNALQQIGVEVEYLRWSDANQPGSVIHFFGRPLASYIEFAHAKNIKVVMTELLGGLAARPTISRNVQRSLIWSSRKILPKAFTAKLAWESYRMADAIIALTAYEARLMREMFDAAAAKVHVVPNGVEKVFIESIKAERGKWLVCTATITERKRILETAKAAIDARAPLWVIGKPYAASDPYFQEFRDLCARTTDLLRYEGAIDDRQLLARIYREARGFVLLSSMESLSLSALEAAACECPLLLSDLPWARSVFQENAMYCPIASTRRTAEELRKFYDSALTLKLPPKPLSWHDVALKLQAIYDRVCSTSS